MTPNGLIRPLDAIASGEHDVVPACDYLLLPKSPEVARKFLDVAQQVARQFGVAGPACLHEACYSHEAVQAIIKARDDEIDALLRHQREQDAEPVAYRYRFADPISGRPVWRFEAGPWNGQYPKETQSLYACPFPRLPGRDG